MIFNYILYIYAVSKKKKIRDRDFNILLILNFDQLHVING
jgi:hypothetical protein